MKKILNKRMIALLLAVMITVGTMAGCNNSDDSTNDTASDMSENTDEATKTDVIDPDAAAVSIDGNDIPASELFYILYNLQSMYEMYGITDWSAVYEDKTYGDVLREEVENSVLQINYLYSLAAEHGIELTDEDLEGISTDVSSFMDYINDGIVEKFGFTEENVKEVLSKSVLGEQGYNAAVAKIVETQSKEVIEENKFRTIQHILISTAQGTTETNESGETVEAETVDEETYKAEKRALAEEVLAKAKAGEDFAALAEEYNDDSSSEYSMNAAGVDETGTTFVTEFVEAANALGEGEISDIVETEYGFHIIKCITTFNEEVSMTAREAVAGNEVYTNYQAWLEEIEYEFKEIWTKYVITALPADETTEETTAETTSEADSEADTTEKATAETTQSE